MIRRLLAASCLALGVGAFAASPASAAPAVPSRSVNVSNGYILCLWNVQPLNVGYCVGI